MRHGHDSNARRFEQIQEELEASKKTIQLLEGSSQESADKYRFLQEMRGYVGDLLECFSEKVRMNAFVFNVPAVFFFYWLAFLFVYLFPILVLYFYVIDLEVYWMLPVSVSIV